MSEHFSHIAAYEDSVRLIQISPEICDDFKLVLKSHYDSGLLGSTSRGNHLFAIPILESLHAKWDTLSQTRDAQIQMTYAIGWIIHRATDLQMKPVFRLADEANDPRFSYQMSSIYHDAMLFRQTYGGGTLPSLSEKEILSPATFDYNMQSHPAAASVDIPRAEPIFNWMWQKDMMSMFNFTSQETNFEQWLDTFVTRFPKLSEDFREYEKAYQHPDPVLTAKYWDEVNLYDESNEILQLTRAIQKGKSCDIELMHALEKAKTQSQYAQALRRCYYFVKGGNDFFLGKITKAEAYEAIEMNEQFRF